jgi:hypothetical protein
MTMFYFSCNERNPREEEIEALASGSEIIVIIVERHDSRIVAGLL